MVAALIAVPAGAEVATRVSEAVVHLHCTSAQGLPDSYGTGVVVSEQGHVVTADHVAPAGYTCEGAISNGSIAHRGLTRVPYRTGVDALLLRFTASPDETFKYLQVCELKPDFQGRDILATGYVDSPQPSIRSGVISTTDPDEYGVIQTDVMTARGMSGGAVTLKGTSDLVGIVSGAKFDSGTGQPLLFGVVAVEFFADSFRLEASAACGKTGQTQPVPAPIAVNNVKAERGGIAIHGNVDRSKIETNTYLSPQ